MSIVAPNYVQGNYSVAERDRIFAKADSYPDANGGLVNQVPTLAADGTIIWRQQSSGGGDGTANANIAIVEDTSTASQAYAVGDLLVYSGQLYRVTTAITQGGTIAPGTNVTPTTVADEISTGVVTSFNGRTGAVSPASGDYTPTQVGATPVIGKGINLLDNGDFRNPVNQRNGWICFQGTNYYDPSDTSLTTPLGQTAAAVQYVTPVTATYGESYGYLIAMADCVPGYAGEGYSIDRWRVSTNGSARTLTLTSSGVTISKTGGTYVGLFQRLPADFVAQLCGKTVTLSALYGTELIKVTVTIPSTITEVEIANQSGTAGWVQIWGIAGGLLDIGLCTSSDSTTILAAKLELGNTQTLAREVNGAWVLNDPPPNFAEELAKCQDYQLAVVRNDSGCAGIGVVINSTFAQVFVPTPTTMRWHGHLDVSFKSLSLYDGNMTVAVSNIVAAALSRNGIIFNVTTASGLTAGNACKLFVDTGVSDAEMLIDGNL